MDSRGPLPWLKNRGARFSSLERWLISGNKKHLKNIQLCLSCYKICPIPLFKPFLTQERNFYSPLFTSFKNPDSLMGHHHPPSLHPISNRYDELTIQSSPLFTVSFREDARKISAFIVCIHPRNNRPLATIEAWLTPFTFHSRWNWRAARSFCRKQHRAVRERVSKRVFQGGGRRGMVERFARSGKRTVSLIFVSGKRRLARDYSREGCRSMSVDDLGLYNSIKSIVIRTQIENHPWIRLGVWQ